MEKKAIIIGAGPAGLTAAYELLKRTDIKPIILEKSGDIGGISKTVNYKGNRIDIGGHRFFSKSDRVMNWWMNIMPIQAEGQTTFNISYQNKSREIDTASLNAIDNAGKDPDKVMLVRRRLSRIYFLRKFFTYPIQLSLDTLTKLGLWTTIAIMFSYLKAQLLPRKPEKNLEDFMINRFGQVLYKLFFKDYTEKVWGIPCDKISAEWGAQRIKGVSISKAIQHAIQSATKKKQKVAGNDIAQKDTETSLIEQFLYPKFGPGQLWEEVARQVESMGGKILMHHDVKRIYTSDSNNQVTAVAAINNITGETSYLEGDYFFSTMPVQELIGGLDGPIPEEVKEVAAGLQYRDFITVGILLKKLSFQDKKTGEWKPLDLKDTWIYIQEKDVKVGRLQLFNNWSPYMVKDPDTAWVGMEFFCNKADDFWGRSDEYIKDLAIRELEKIGLASQANVLDATVLRMEKTYPAYFGAYERFDLVREYVDRFENLFLMGRNGMHKYNNSDHSMLTAMIAIDNILAGIIDKRNIWEVNTEKDYHEEKARCVEEKRETSKTVADPIVHWGPWDNPALSSDKYRTRMGSFRNAEGLFNSSFFTSHKGVLLLIVFTLLIQFCVFKVLYPFANYMPDSYSYLEAASINASVNLWPVGYSKFLRVFGSIFKSDIVLVFFQYMLLQLATIYFTLTVLQFFRMSKIVTNILLLLFTLNPIALYISNYVTADSIFASLSLIWITQLWWVIFDPKPYHAYVQALILLILFSIRYNALYYPLISLAVLFTSNLSWRNKIRSVALTILLLGIFVWHTGNQYKNMIGERRFSVFGGWQLASNALFMYSHVMYDDDVPPERFKILHNVVKKHMDSLKSLKNRPDTSLGIYYLWDNNAPLMKYLAYKWKKDTVGSELTKWASVANLYSTYGRYLIMKHPVEFGKYFIWPNMVNYYIPPIEFLGVYNMRGDSVSPIAKNWFGYKSQRVESYSKDTPMLICYPILFAVCNIVFVCGLITFFILKGHKTVDSRLTKALIFILIIWITNFMFSIVASPIVLRYQIFPMLVLALFSLILVEYIYKFDGFSELTKKQF